MTLLNLEDWERMEQRPTPDALRAGHCRRLTLGAVGHGLRRARSGRVAEG